MCESCWRNDFGSASNNSPEIQQAIPLIHRIWDESESSLPLHTAIDDWNVQEHWEPWPDHKKEVSDECWQAAVELSELMNSMSVEDRASALARANGFIDEN